MSFLSLEFFVFFLVFLFIYWACAARPGVQNLLVLAAGYALVSAASPYFVLVLYAYTAGIYLCAALISHRREHGKAALWLSLLLALSALGVFKYFDFFREAFNELALMLGVRVSMPALEIIAPLGISFYTFHSISYLVSLQRGEIEPARGMDLALFIGFFPSFLAGPINRAVDFLPQIRPPAPRELTESPRALLLIALAIIKVVWLSDWLAVTWADPVFASPRDYHALDALLGLVAYAWQLYFNFSGYTDLVTGLALLLGYRLPRNFDAPYLARNLRDFWRRWHISLSTWIRDYVYIPLGGSRQGWGRTQFNLLIAFALSGLWHGASLNFLIWGGLHGCGMVLLDALDRVFGRSRLSARLPRLATVCTFAYVTFAWVFFRCPTPAESIEFLRALAVNWTAPLQFNSVFYLALMSAGPWLYPMLCRGREALLAWGGVARWPGLTAAVFLLCWLGLVLSPPGIPSFIYASF